VLGHQVAQRHQVLAHDRRHVAGIFLLSHGAREREQARGEIRRRARRVVNLIEVRALRRAAGNRPLEQLGVNADRHQLVVELVRERTGETTEGVHALRRAQLVLEAQTLGALVGELGADLGEALGVFFDPSALHGERAARKEDDGERAGAIEDRHAPAVRKEGDRRGECDERGVGTKDRWVRDHHERRHRDHERRSRVERLARMTQEQPIEVRSGDERGREVQVALPDARVRVSQCASDREGRSDDHPQRDRITRAAGPDEPPERVHDARDHEGGA